MKLPIEVEVCIRKEHALEQIKKEKDKWVTFSEYQRLDVDVDDLEDPDASDVIALYNELGDKEQKKVIYELPVVYAEARKIAEKPKTVAEEMELELLLSFRGKYSLDELKRRLESPVFVTDMAQTGSCKWCYTSDTLSEFLDE